MFYDIWLRLVSWVLLPVTKLLATTPMMIVLPCAIVVVAFVLRKRLVEQGAFFAYGATESVIEFEHRLTETQIANEWAFYASLSDGSFRSHIDNWRQKAAAELKAGEILALHASRRSQNNRAQKSGWVVNVLRERSARRIQNQQNILRECARLEILRTDITRSQRTQVHQDLREIVVQLIRELDQDYGPAAHEALTRLNAIGSGFDWESLLPLGFPELARGRVAKVIRQMVGSTSIVEARKAKSQFIHMLKHFNFSFEPNGVPSCVP